MIERTCDLLECTFPETGTCLKGYTRVEECESHQAALAKLQESSTVDAFDEVLPEVPGTEEKRPPQSALHRSMALGWMDADELLQDRYVHQIGIVGLPDAGKTACIASLYLLAAKGKLDGFSFSDSETLLGFEEIVRGARHRTEAGLAPTQMTSHTQLVDERQVGYLHIRLKREADGRKFDLLLPDLPGEWSQSLINGGDGQRLRFLKSSDVIWITVDGRQFQDPEKRARALHRASLLLERLSTLLGAVRPHIIVVASWRDMGEFPIECLESLRQEAAAFSFELELASIASFSDSEQIAPGYGIANLVARSVTTRAPAAPGWPRTDPLPNSRSFLTYRDMT